VAAAVTVMGMHRVGAVLVMEHGRIGASSQPVSHWMTRDPVTVGPEASVEQPLEIMLARHFRHLPVMDEESLVAVDLGAHRRSWTPRP
jgi:predicted transcriptional regulator